MVWEIQAGKVSVKLYCFLVIGDCRVHRIAESAENMVRSVVSNLSNEFGCARTSRDTLVTSGIPATQLAIRTISGVIGFPQIHPSIVKLVPVSVIDKNTGNSAENNPVHVDDIGAIAITGAAISHRVAALKRIPLVLKNFLGIFGVDDGELALRQGNQNSIFAVHSMIPSLSAVPLIASTAMQGFFRALNTYCTAIWATSAFNSSSLQAN